MSTRDSLSTILAGSIIMMIASKTFAEPFLFPMDIGLRFVYEETKAVSTRYIVGEFTEKQNINSIDYYLLESWELGSPELSEAVDLVRSTENEVFRYNFDIPSGGEYLEFQKAPVGTNWNFYDPHISGYDYKVIEIVAIEQVTVPYGTFENAYKHRRYRCIDPVNLALGQSPDWYEWIVPGVGVVKKVDYWGEYEIEELVDIYVVPAPGAFLLSCTGLSFAAWKTRRRKHI